MSKQVIQLQKSILVKGEGELLELNVATSLFSILTGIEKNDVATLSSNNSTFKLL